jgi:hypothetical protein
MTSAACSSLLAIGSSASKSFANARATRAGVPS